MSLSASSVSACLSLCGSGPPLARCGGGVRSAAEDEAGGRDIFLRLLGDEAEELCLVVLFDVVLLGVHLWVVL